MNLVLCFAEIEVLNTIVILATLYPVILKPTVPKTDGAHNPHSVSISMNVREITVK